MRRNRFADQSLTVAEPFARSIQVGAAKTGSRKDAVQEDTGNLAGLRRGDIHDPQAETRIFRLVAGVDERDFAAVGRPFREADFGVCGQARDRDGLAAGKG